jgi:hypothetical protein
MQADDCDAWINILCVLFSVSGRKISIEMIVAVVFMGAILIISIIAL